MGLVVITVSDNEGNMPVVNLTLNFHQDPKGPMMTPKIRRTPQ